MIPKQKKSVELTSKPTPLVLGEKRKMFRKPRDREAVVFCEPSASSKRPWTRPDRRGEKRRRIPSEPVVFLYAASYEYQPQVDIIFGCPSIQRTEKTEEEAGVFLHAASYDYQPQVDITFGAPSIQRTEKTEEEAPAASEEAVRKEQVRPEKSVSFVTENFQAFLSDEGLDGEESMQEAVELVFKRAVQKPDSAAVFAELCQRLSTVEVQSLTDWSASVSFRSLLVKHCQAQFRKNFDREDISQKSGSCLEPVRDVRVTDRLREERNNARPSCRSLKSIRFIGALFLSKVLAEKAMHSCIRRLLQNGDGPSLESLCELLQLIQQDLEGVTSREVMDSFYNQLEVIAEEGKRAPRLSLLLKDTVDARKRAGSTPH